MSEYLLNASYCVLKLNIILDKFLENFVVMIFAKCFFFVFRLSGFCFIFCLIACNAIYVCVVSQVVRSSASPLCEICRNFTSMLEFCDSFRART